MSNAKNRIGQRYGTLVVTSRAGTYTPNMQATWHCRCDCGAEIIVRSSHLGLGYVQSCGDRTLHAPVGRGKGTRYNSVHAKVRAILGSASEYGCNHTDCDSWAAEWAYDHLDTNEVRTPSGNTYSMDADHYVPYCAKHHREFDAEHARLMRRADNMRRAISKPVNPLDHKAFKALRKAIEEVGA